jgi:plastocyanin domain-containing protein|tara:strand:- start:204 stop:557 length:354 start_codon:yes stop_codon:yes gene_type:complete
MLIINILGVLLIGLIVWWFWLYKPKEVVVSEEGIIVTVEDGTYQPSRLKLPSGKSTTIQFIRKDASPCAAMVLFPDFNISEELPLGKNKSITLPAMTKGEYAFHCQMQMYRGTLLVD